MTRASAYLGLNETNLNEEEQGIRNLNPTTFLYLISFLTKNFKTTGETKEDQLKRIKDLESDTRLLTDQKSPNQNHPKQNIIHVYIPELMTFQTTKQKPKKILTNVQMREIYRHLESKSVTNC
jgi:hypothetical protein